MAARAVVFIDGNNWYHSIQRVGATGLHRFDYALLSRKLVGHRQWLATRYYIGQVAQHGDPRLLATQRRFLSRLQSSDPRISVHLGRLESRRVDNSAARELQHYLQSLSVRIDPRVFRDLRELATRHRNIEVVVEKAVDVMITVDMVVMAGRDAYDVAYLLSADGDLTPAAEAVRRHGKQVFAVSASYGAQLRAACDAFIRVDRAWLQDCYSRRPT